MISATPTIVLALAMALTGLALGLLYFRALRRTADLFASGGDWRGPVLLSLSRLAAAVIVLGLMAKLGAVPLLAGFFGFLAARMMALRAARRAG